MKNNKDIMCVYEKYNRRNELRLELHCSGKDRLTQKYKVYIKTIPVPKNLKGKKELEQFRLQCQLDWKDEVDKISNGIISHEKVKIIPFCDYAQQWVDNILVYNPEAYHHYSNCLGNMKIFREKLSKYALQDMSLKVVQEFCKWICERKYKKDTIIVKKSIRNVIEEKKLTLTKTAKESGISSTTLKVALELGNHINKESANRICKYLDISFNDYFELTSVDMPYSLSANRNLKIMLSSILSQAVIEGLIPTNFAMKPYIKTIAGRKANKDKVIYKEKDEIQNFINTCLKEKDIRKRIAFLLSIGLGTRGCELAGLCWSDIDLVKGTVNISKGTMYVYGFGVVNKSTTKNNEERTINIPLRVLEELKVYRTWWLQEKIMHGDLWAKTDKLFVRNDGKDMANTTIAGWLKEFQEKNNLKRVSLHGLRHSNITLQVLNGIDVRTVADRVGHKHTDITLDVYTQNNKNTENKASQVLDSELFSCVMA